MKTIYLVRHAITIENEKGLSQGHKFGTISETGYKQIEHLCKHFKTIPVDVIISSDLARCQITARELEKVTKAPVLFSPLIRELARGDWEGTQKVQADYDALPGSFEERRPPNGESLFDAQKRAIQLWKDIQQFDSENIAIISHGGFLKLLIGNILGMPIKDSILKLHIKNCSISIIELNKEETRLLVLNHTAHLP